MTSNILSNPSAIITVIINLALISLSSQLQFADAFTAQTRSSTFAIHRLNHIHANINCQQLNAKSINNDNHDEDINNDKNNNKNKAVVTRRETISKASSFLLAATSASMGIFTTNSQPANAGPGLVQFPCNYKLMNTYHFMRSGESLLESENILSSNPLFLTNRNDALSEVGIGQVEAACGDMMEHGVNPSVLKYGLAAKSIDTANIIATQMLVGRNRLIPEYTFMDPRGVGLWDMQELSTMEEAIWAMDHDETGKNGDGVRPPPTDDSTPNETLAEQAIRLRQLMSVMETQFSGDTVLLVFPDGTSPALLMCLMAGIPLNRVHEFNYKPGEVRYDITMDTVLNSLYVPSLSSEAAAVAAASSVGNDNDADVKYRGYMASINRGREILKKARDDPSQFIEVEEEGKDYYQPMIRTRNPNKEMNTEVSQSQKMALMGIGLYGLISNLFAPQDDDSDVHVNAGDVNTSDIQYTDKEGKEEDLLNRRSDDIEDAPELQRMQELIVKAPFDIPEMDDEKDKQEKVEKADVAMDEYLNRDDGGDDWLGLMNDLLHEE